MTQLAPIPFPPIKILAQEKKDLSAEGSPPGKVARAVPVTPGKEVKPVSRLPLTVPGGNQRVPSASER
jgi:hypothetical protein